MTDIAINYENQGFVITKQGSNFLLDESLRTSVILSLFCDRRAPETENLEPFLRRGYWADPLFDDEWGSLLWLLLGKKITKETVAMAKQYCEDALEWMVTDGLAEKVSVLVERQGTYMLAIQIQIYQPDKTNESYSFLWDAERKIQRGE